MAQGAPPDPPGRKYLQPNQCFFCIFLLPYNYILAPIFLGLFEIKINLFWGAQSWRKPKKYPKRTLDPHFHTKKIVTPKPFDGFSWRSNK